MNGPLLAGINGRKECRTGIVPFLPIVNSRIRFDIRNSRNFHLCIRCNMERDHGPSYVKGTTQPNETTALWRYRAIGMEARLDVVNILVLEVCFEEHDLN